MIISRITWACTILVVAFGLLGLSPLGIDHPYDKLLHLAFFCSATVLALNITPPRFVLPVLAFLLIGSVGIEVVQAFIPDRTASIGDVIANATGILAGVGFFKNTTHIITYY